jgi:pilus assembly protein FimV
MAQTNLLELAKQGDPQAIATLMNRSLQPRGMTASVDRQGSCLYVTLQAEQVPNRQVLTAFVQNGISNLGVSSIQLVKIAGQQFGMAEPAWTQDLQIDTPDLGDLGLGDLGTEGPEPSDLTAPPYEADLSTDISLNGLDDIAPAPNPVGDILSELTGSPRPVPPPIPTFKPEGLSLEDSALDFENEFAAGDPSEDFSLEAIATDDTDSSNLSDDDLLADLDLGTDLGSTDLGLEAFDNLNTSFGETTDDDLGLGGLGDLGSSLPASDADSLDSDFSDFDLGSDSFDSAFSNTTPSDAGMRDLGMREPSGEALLSDPDALESTQDWSLDEPDELLNDLGSLEDDLAQMGDEFLGIDAVTGEAQAGMGLEPDEFDFSADLSSGFSADFSTEPVGEADEFGTDLAGLDLPDSASALDSGSLELIPEAVDFPLTDFDELRILSSSSEPSSEPFPEPLSSDPLSGLDDLDFGDSASGDAGFGNTSLDDVAFGSTEFGSTEFGSTDIDFSSPDLGDASLSNADFDFDLGSAEASGESAAADDLADAFADLEADGTSTTDDWQDAIAPEAIAAGYESEAQFSEAQFDDLLAAPSPTEFGSATDFAETAPTPAPYLAEEVSLDLDLDDIQLPPVTTESGDDWDADLEFGNLAGDDLSDFTANPAAPAETAAEAAAELETLDLDSEFTSAEFGSPEFGSTEFGSTEFGGAELGDFGGTEFTSGDWEISTPAAEPGSFDEDFDLEPAPFPPDFAAPAASSPQSDSAPWLSELPPELVIDVTLNALALDAAGGETVEAGAVGAIAEEFPNLAQDLELEPQDLQFESSAADSMIAESPSSATSSDLDFGLGDLGGLDALDSLNNSDSPGNSLDAALFEESLDIPLSQLPTEIPSSEIHEDNLGASDFLDAPLSGVDFDEAAFSSAFNETPVDEFTLEDETAPTEIMTPSEEILPSELLVDDLDASDGFELDNLGVEPDSPERPGFQPAEPETSNAEDLGLDRPDGFNLDAPAADWQSNLEPLPETTFRLEGDDETTILLDPSAYPGSSFDSAAQSPDLDREELDWLTNEVAASANPPAAPLSAAEEGWSYGIPPAPRPPDESFAFPANAPATPDRAIAEMTPATEAADEESARAGGRVTNLLYAVLLTLLAWIVTLIGRSLWVEWSQPEPPPAPEVEVSPQSQEPEPGRSPFSNFS